MTSPRLKKEPMRNPRLSQAEEDCLAGFCRFFLGVEETIVFGREELRFEVMTDVMARNGCSGIMFSVLDQLETPWPEKEVLRFRDHYFSILAANELYVKLAVELSGKFIRQGERCIFFKGLGLIGSAYREHGWRPLSDIDVLVPGKEVAQRLAKLVGVNERTKENSGFTRRYKDFNRLNCRVSFSGRDVGMEFHYPMPNPALPLSMLIDLAKDDLFGGGNHFSGSLAVPDPAIHLLLLLVHLVNHHLGTRLIWHLDIAALIRHHGNGLDWDKVAQYAEAVEFLSILKFVLGSIAARFNVPVPGIIFDRRGRIALSSVNHGLLAAMTSGSNVFSDRFGGRRIWESPALSITKLKAILFYSLFPLLFNDQTGKWYGFNFGNARKSEMLAGLLALTLNKNSRPLCPAVKTALRYVVLPLLSVWVFPILLYFQIIKKPKIPNQGPGSPGT